MSVVGRRTVLNASAAVGEDVTVSRSSTIHTQATLSDGVFIGYASTIHANASIGANSVIGNLASVGARTVLAPTTVLARGVSVGEDATIGVPPAGLSVVIGPECAISDDVTMGENVRIRKNTNIGIGSTIADDVRIGRDSNLATNVTVGVGVQLRANVTGLPNSEALDGEFYPRDSYIGFNFTGSGVFPDASTFNTVWYVSPTGNDTTGDGSLINPYFNLKVAVTAASSGDGIYMMPGTHTMDDFLYGTVSSAAIYDLGKNLHIWGANGSTVLHAYGENSSGRRDYHAITLSGASSVVSNMQIDYKPNRGGTWPTASNAIFAWTAIGAEVRNVYFQNVSTSRYWTYTYNNTRTGTPKVYDSVFNANGRSTTGYSGGPLWTNCLFTHTPGRGSRINSLTRAVTTDDQYLTTAPTDLRDGAGNVTIGTGSGLYPWVTP